MITILVADDQAVVRAGIAAVLDAERDMTVVGQAADGQAAVELTLQSRPDVVLMDVRMPGLDGLRATARITAEVPGTRVVVLTTFGLDDYVFGALRAGAAGFLLKDAEPERVIDAVRVVAAGDAMLDPGITRRLIDRFVQEPPPYNGSTGMLTPRETEVLKQVATGLSNAEIGAVLGISPATVKDHIAVILGKLGVRNRLQATIAAYETGLVRPAARRGEQPIPTEEEPASPPS